MTVPYAILRGAHENTSKIMVPIEVGTEVCVGRKPSNDIVISASFMSDLHCKFTSRVDHVNNKSFVYLTDLSENGTYLDGTLIGRNKTVILLHGSIVSFVSCHLTMSYIQIKTYENDLYKDEIFTMDFHPGLLIDPEHKKDRTITVKSTNKSIGHGNQAEVLLAYDCSSPSHQLVIRRTKQSLSLCKDTETRILKNSRHVNVLSMIAQFKKDSVVRSLFPLYAGGTLRQHVLERSSLNDKDASFLFKQVLSGLQYIHRNGIIHCDLKPDNILLSGLENRTRVVIADFGLSVYKSKKLEIWPDNYGTIANHPPELLNNKEYNEKVDCWCAGLVLYFMISGTHPFLGYRERGLDLDITCHNIKNKSPDLDSICFKDISSLTKSLISALLDKDQHTRYNCDDCFKSNWVLNIWSKDKAFMDDYRVAVIQDFQIERARWFDDANFKTIREPGIPIMPHPDDNEEDVTIIKKHRCSNEHHCLYTFKKVLSYEAKDEFEILEAINGERFPKISLGKRKLRENDMNGSEQAISVNKRSFSEASVSVAALEEELDGFSVQADDAPNSNITVTTTTTTTTTVTTTKTSKKDKSSTTSSEK